jgi:aminoglycoside phosphotransferase (APT) family kinase protein
MAKTSSMPPWRASSDASPTQDHRGIDVPLTEEWARGYFEHRLPGRPKIASVSIQRMPRGVSRETWEVNIQRVDSAAERLIVRRDVGAISVDGIALDQEYAIYDRLQRTEVPVARVLWFEKDDAWRPGGRQFYVRQWIEGSWNVPDAENSDPAYDTWRIDLSKEHIRALAKVHLADWQTLGFAQIMPVPSSASMAARELIERFEKRVRQYEFHAQPLATEAIRILKDRAPRHASAICLCKGTNGLGEEVWQDGKIVAMSDWELAIIGDPAYDFCQLQNLVPQIEGKWGWPEALAYYRDLTGTTVDQEQIAVYRAIYSVQQLAYALNAAKSIIDRRDDQIRLCWVGSEILYYAVSQLAAAADILTKSH